MEHFEHSFLHASEPLPIRAATLLCGVYGVNITVGLRQSLRDALRKLWCSLLHGTAALEGANTCRNVPSSPKLLLQVYIADRERCKYYSDQNYCIKYCSESSLGAFVLAGALFWGGCAETRGHRMLAQHIHRSPSNTIVAFLL